MKPVADPGPQARLQRILLDDVDGILLRVPGTMEVCAPTGIFTLAVESADGVCREIVEGSATRYRCEHFEGDTLRSYAEMRIDPGLDPPANCEKTGGRGSCQIDLYSQGKRRSP